MVNRLTDGPIIDPSMDTRLGDNINGPSLIRVPDWIANPLGRYYLYFAHHQGTFIRLAYADRIEGPYIVYSPGVLDLKDTPFAHHIASPEVHVDDERRQIYMLYHGGGPTNENTLPYKQVTSYAESGDGLGFVSDRVYVGPPYLRTFAWHGYHYGFAGGGQRLLYRSRDPRRVFEYGIDLHIEGEPFTHSADDDASPSVYRMRHPAVHRVGDRLDIYYSNVGDAPERIKMTSVDLRDDWTEWRGTPVVEVLQPETDYEGVGEPVSRSIAGVAHRAAHELRDPYVYEEDGHVYLFYTVAGECGIGVAEIR